MSRIVLATMGSLGDLHPMIALALELRARGHTPVINSWANYAEKVGALGLEFHPLRPYLDPADEIIIKAVMDARKGPEMVIRQIVFPALGDMYADLAAACEGADALISGELVYVAGSFVEKTGIKWISTTLSPMLMFSAYDPNVYPTAEWIEILRPMPAFFHRMLFSVMRRTLSGWYPPWRDFREGIGLSPDAEPIFDDKYSDLLHLAMFSRAIGSPQPDWHKGTIQTGFCFYDESGLTELEPELQSFLDCGEPPVVFTLGSAASMDAGDFFEQSSRAARLLGRRAVLLYGRDQPVPKGLGDEIVGFEYAPYSLVFPGAACVVHQGGVGTTSQVLRAGVPHLIMPYSHDQPDNAARCRRRGVAQIISRGRYNADRAAKALDRILNNVSYRERARPLKAIIESEGGTRAACDAIENVLR